MATLAIAVFIAILFTTGTLLGAAFGVLPGLRTARKALTTEDRAIGVVSVVASAAPAWIWGVLLILVFGLMFPVLPYGACSAYRHRWIPGNSRSTSRIT